MRQVFGFLLILICTVTFSNVSFGQSQESIREASKNKPFEILYFEELPETALQTLESQANNNFSKTTQGVWLFEAFGKQFRLSLNPNTRLIEKVPQQKRQQLEKDLRFYRGKLEGITESWARLTRVGQQWSGMIWDGEEAYIIDPLSIITPALRTVPSSSSSGQAIYRLSDTRDLGTQTCGLGESMGMPALPMSSFEALVEELQDRVGITAQGATRNIDMTVVTDQQFNSANSNPVAAVIARMNVVDGIFSEQLSVQISLVEVLPLQSNGGLTSTNANTLLDQFSQFTRSGSFNHPGVAHLFTGRNLNGSTIGIAFLRSLCDARFGVGVNQITGTGTAGALTVAHELGHNFGAPHDNEAGSPCASTPDTFLMNPFLNGSDRFSPCSVSQIQPVVNGASCLTFINIDQTDLQPRFQTTPQDIPLGQPFSLVLSVTNNGQAPAFNARAEISIPNGLSLENIRANPGSCSGGGTNQGSCMVDTIPAGGKQEITLTLNGASAGSFTLLATVAADNEENTGNNTTKGTITMKIGGGGAFPPPIAAPAPGSTLTSSTVTFTGAHSTQDTQHWVYVGSTPGAKNYYAGGVNGAHQFTVSGLPASGTNYVRYSSRTCSTCAWQHQLHSYAMKADGDGAFPPSIAAPAPGSTLTSSVVPFTGAHTSQDYQHGVYVGPTPGSGAFYAGVPNGKHQFTVSGLPASGTIYVRYSSRSCSACTWETQSHAYRMNVGGN